MADKWTSPLTYSSSAAVAAALYDFLTATCGYFLPAPNAKVGDWSLGGAALASGDFVILETPSDGPFRQQIGLTYSAEAGSPHAIEVSLAPLVGIAGGWNQGSATFTEPTVGPKLFYLAPGTQKAAFVANSRRVFVRAWSTPATLTSPGDGDISFLESPPRINRDGGSLIDEGYLPGTLAQVSGSASNNKLFCVEDLDPANLFANAAPAIVAEGVGTATLTPRPVCHAFYAGGIEGAHAADIRPHALNAGLFGIGAQGQLESPQTLGEAALSFAQGWRRIHADTSGGYVKLSAGFLQTMLQAGGAYSPLVTAQPSWNGHYTPIGALLCFNETVSALARKELPAGALDGVFLSPLAKYMELLGDDNELLVRDGLGGVWPSGSTAL